MGGHIGQWGALIGSPGPLGIGANWDSTEESVKKKAFYITPSLWVGQPTGSGLTICADSVQALSVIKDGGVAVLPEGSFDEADKTLEALGIAKPVREDRIHFAKTGSTLRAV